MTSNNQTLSLGDLRNANVTRLDLQVCSKVDHTWIPAQWMNALVGEIGEAANFIKKVDRGDSTIDETRNDIAKELADAQMYLDLLAYKLDIDLSQATADKFNEVSDRHGCDIKLRVLPKQSRNLLWLLMEFDINRYLMSNADGRWDGSEKASRHRNLVNTYVTGVTGCDTDNCFDHIEYWEAIHRTTQALTSHLDEVIDFPLFGRPDYDALAPEFFDKFIELCDSVPVT